MADSRRDELLQRLRRMQSAEMELHSVREECHTLRTQLAESKGENERILAQQRALVTDFADRGRKMESLMRQLVEERNRLAAQLSLPQEPSRESKAVQTLRIVTDSCLDRSSAAVQVTPSSVHSSSQTTTQDALESSDGCLPTFFSPQKSKAGVVSVFPTSPSVTRSLQVPWVINASSDASSSFLLALGVAIREKTIVRVVHEGSRRYVALCDRGWWRWYVVEDQKSPGLVINAWDENGVSIDWPSAVHSAVREYGRSRQNGISDLSVISFIRLIACLSAEGPFRWTQIDVETVSQSLSKREYALVLTSASGGEIIVNDIAAHESQYFFFVVYASDGQLHSQWLPLDTVVALFESVYFCRSEAEGTKDVRFRTFVDDAGYTDVGLWFPAHLRSTTLSDRVMIRFVDRHTVPSDLDGNLVPVGYESFSLMCPALRGSGGRDCICIIYVRRWSAEDPIRFGFVSRPRVDEYTGMISLQHCIVAAQIDGNDVRTSTVERCGFGGEANSEHGLAVITMGHDVGTCTELNVMDDVVGDDYRLASHRNLVGEMQLLQLDFQSLEASALRRAMNFLDGRTNALLYHVSALIEVAIPALCATAQQAAFSGATRWLGSALENCDWKYRTASDVLVDHVVSRAARINRDLCIADRIATQSQQWASQWTDSALQLTAGKADEVMDNVPRVGITATEADFTFPAELLAIELAEHYAEMCFIRLFDAMQISKILVHQFVEQNLAFVHHSITLLDEMDDKIAELENLLIRPQSFDKETMARSNTGDIAFFCSELAKCRLQLATMDDYFTLIQQRNELLDSKAKAEGELRSGMMEVDVLNDRCSALAEECESLSSKLESADESQKGLILRLQQALERIEQLQAQLYESDHTLVKIEGEKHVVVAKYETQVEELSSTISTLKNENGLLKEELEAAVSAPQLTAVQKGKSVTPKSKLSHAPAYRLPTGAAGSMLSSDSITTPPSAIEKLPPSFAEIPVISVSGEEQSPAVRPSPKTGELKPLRKTISMRVRRP